MRSRAAGFCILGMVDGTTEGTERMEGEGLQSLFEVLAEGSVLRRKGLFIRGLRPSRGRSFPPGKWDGRIFQTPIHGG